MAVAIDSMAEMLASRTQTRTLAVLKLALVQITPLLHWPHTSTQLLALNECLVNEYATLLASCVAYART